MLSITSRTRRAIVVGAIASLSLTLSACSGGSPSGSSSSASSAAGPATAGATEGATTAPTIVASDDFCANAIAAVAAADDFSAAMNDLNTAMSSNDINALHTAGQALMDHSDQATAFYAAGAAAADDQATKDAFNGMVSFVSDYATLMGQAAVDAASVPAFMGAVATIIADPATVPLMSNAGDWATTIKDFTTAHCSLT